MPELVTVDWCSACGGVHLEGMGLEDCARCANSGIDPEGPCIVMVPTAEEEARMAAESARVNATDEIPF